MNILVVGNGFDIAHGLPTKYGDFLAFLRHYNQFITNDNAVEQDEVDFEELILLKNEIPELFDEINELISDNRWYHHFVSLYESRINEGRDGWIDFEKEISNIIQTLDKVRLRIHQQFEQGSVTTCLNDFQIEQLKVIIWGNVHLDYTQEEFDLDFINSLKSQLLTDLNRLTRCLEIYLAYCIHITQCHTLPLIEKLDIQYVLNFNYTDTYKLLYDRDSTSITYHYIHGFAKKESNIETCNMILGIDEYLENPLKNTDNEFAEFKKFFQRIYKGTGNIYTEWLHRHQQLTDRYQDNVGAPNMNVYIFGHSLDKTDGDVLRKLILCENTTTTIFYHSRDAFAKQLVNLIAVIGEDELIKRTDKSSQSIFFEPIENVT